MIVTGGGGYVGSAIVQALVESGAHVVSLDVRDRAADGVKGAVIADVADPSSCEYGLAEALRLLGGLDALICAAGVLLRDDGELGVVSETTWEKTMAVNAKGAWLAASYALPFLRLGENPAITFIGSVAADRGSSRSQLAYAASKGVVATLTTELAISLAPLGIRVNRVSPGPLKGGLLESILEGPGQTELRQGIIPIGRLGLAEDVARACLFLTEAGGGYMTGVNVVVDGGLSVKLM